MGASFESRNSLGYYQDLLRDANDLIEKARDEYITDESLSKEDCSFFEDTLLWRLNAIFEELSSLSLSIQIELDRR